VRAAQVTPLSLFFLYSQTDHAALHSRNIHAFSQAHWIFRRPNCYPNEYVFALMTKECARIDRRFGRVPGRVATTITVPPDGRTGCIREAAAKPNQGEGNASSVAQDGRKDQDWRQRDGDDRANRPQQCAPRDLNIVREELVSNEPVLNQSQGTSESSVHP
jgi:hypothetical protein